MSWRFTVVRRAASPVAAVPSLPMPIRRPKIFLFTPVLELTLLTLMSPANVPDRSAFATRIDGPFEALLRMIRPGRVGTGVAKRSYGKALTSAPENNSAVSFTAGSLN